MLGELYLEDICESVLEAIDPATESARGDALTD